MTPDQIFSIANTSTLVPWLLLVVVPRHRVTRIVAGTVAPALFAAAYVIVVATHFGQGKGDFQSLTGVAGLFSNPWILLAGWLHYLAFDLLVGNWEASDARARGIPHLLVVPSLVLTLMFGPAGWALYHATRFSYRRFIASPATPALSL